VKISLQANNPDKTELAEQMDKNQKTALHYSIENYYEQSTCTLLKYSNALNFNQDDDPSLVNKCLKRTPRALIQIFDRALKFRQNAEDSTRENNNNNILGSMNECFKQDILSNGGKNDEQEDLTLTVDFKYLFGRPSSIEIENEGKNKDHRPLRESELLYKILGIKDRVVYENLLGHPVLHAYLEKKWRRTQLQFLFLRLLHVSRAASCYYSAHSTTRLSILCCLIH